MTLLGLGVPFLLIAALYGVFQPVLKAIEMMDQKRDRVLDLTNSYTLKHRKLLYADWKMIRCFTYGFVALVGAVIASAPFYLIAKGNELLVAQIACIVFAVVLFGFASTGLVNGMHERKAMKKFLEQIESQEEGSHPYVR